MKCYFLRWQCQTPHGAHVMMLVKGEQLLYATGWVTDKWLCNNPILCYLWSTVLCCNSWSVKCHEYISLHHRYEWASRNCNAKYMEQAELVLSLTRTGANFGPVSQECNRSHHGSGWSYSSSSFHRLWVSVELCGTCVAAMLVSRSSHINSSWPPTIVLPPMSPDTNSFPPSQRLAFCWRNKPLLWKSGVS